MAASAQPKPRPVEEGLADLPVAELRDRLARGALDAEALTAACLARIDRLEPEVQAWVWLDPDFALHQARALDSHRRSGRAIGALHGLPVGLKDIIDTARIPTGNGTEIDAGRVPAGDAAVVARLKAAGAVILGKTVTTELAFMAPSRTRNPTAPGHTPGGSSAGSAAAVAAGMVPLAVGTQTGGSVIRPASYCGVTGFKPSFGAIPRTGILSQSPTLDTVGVFSRDIEGAALLADALFGHDPADPETAPAPPARLFEIAGTAPPVRPTFCFVRPPGWEEAHPDLGPAFAELTQALGEDRCFEAPLPDVFAEAATARRRINLAEMAHTYRRYARTGRDHLSDEMRAALDEGAGVAAADYLAALDWRRVLSDGIAPMFERCDAVLTPAATGPAPEGYGSTGSPLFNGLWTLLGLPAVTLPILQSADGLPMGVQLVGPRGGDARLLRTARWLAGWARDMDRETDR